jgi:hypothetical protein
MNSTAASPEAMIESFPNRHIPKIIGIPTYKFICATKAALAQNSVSIPTTVIGINNPSAMQVRTHAELLREWREYCNIEQALKKQLADSMDPIYLRAVCDPYVGYNNRSLRELIAHIIGLYGNITPPEFKENDQWFNTPWDPNTPLESLISQIETAVEYANASNQAYTPTQVVNTAFTLIFNTGIYLDECKRWNQRDAAGQTWQDLKTFFSRQPTSSASNNRQHNEPASMEPMQPGEHNRHRNHMTTTTPPRLLQISPPPPPPPPPLIEQHSQA